MSRDKSRRFGTDEEWAKLRELHSIKANPVMPLGERQWAAARYEELSTTMVRRMLGWLNGEPAA